ncbi:MAG TPA: chemotaxis protein CheW [Thiopseudomonas sp.]|nr:chemotaxis protein CheW [Thiopseudomonas sp.]
MSKDTQHAALQNYLDELLDDPVPEEQVESVLSGVAQLAPAHSELHIDQPYKDLTASSLTLPQAVLREPLISEEQISRLPVSAGRLEAQDNDDDTQSSAAVVVEVEVEPDPELGPVSWAESAFEALLFDVAGLALAVPLSALGTIYRFEADELTPLFGQPDWFLGILATPQGTLKVLETARWVMPERYTAGSRDNLKYVISINGCDWGLAVHQVRHAIRLQPDQVKWRTQRSQRAWLAGTVIEHMCALLDLEVLAQLITVKDAPRYAISAVTEKL